MMRSLLLVTPALIGPIASSLDSQETHTISKEMQSTPKEDSRLVYSDYFFPIPYETFLKISDIRELFLQRSSNFNDALEIRMQKEQK